jgi:two-component system OmpR family response regulator
MRILVVEDDPSIAQVLREGLHNAGFEIDFAGDGLEGLNLATMRSYDAAIIDLMLPRLDGLSLIDRLRKLEVHTPVLILSARQSVDDRVKGLQTGGDDYLTKPFAFAELQARLQSLIRRSQGTPETTRLSVGQLSMDLLKREVRRGDQVIDLQPKEFDLLAYLMRNAGRVVSKAMLIKHVWDFNFDPETNVVEARVCRLRDKIDKGTGPGMIHTIRGVGYVLRAENATA